jgi:hypothetical protein
MGDVKYMVPTTKSFIIENKGHVRIFDYNTRSKANI